MIFSKREFFVLVLLQLLWISNAADDFNVNAPDWEVISKGWPILTDQTSREFFYLKGTNNEVSLSFQDTFTKQFTETNQNLRLSFKYWQNPIDNTHPQAEVRFSKDVNNDPLRETISSRYQEKYQNKWMECQYIISRKQLAEFKIIMYIFGSNPIVAIKDVKIEYESLTPTNDPSHRIKKNKYFASDISPVPNAPTVTVTPFDQCDFKSKNCIDKTRIDLDTLEIPIDKFDEQETCFDLEFSSKNPTTIEAYFIAANNMLENKFFSHKLNTNADKETASFCLRDHIRLITKNITVFFNIKPMPKEKDDLRLRIGIRDITHLPTLNSLEYLPSTVENGFGNYWKPLTNKAVNFEDKTFSVNRAGNGPASFKLFSEWVKYTDSLADATMKYSLSVKDAEIFNYFEVRPKICDELSYCFDVQKLSSSTKTIDSKKVLEIHYSFSKLIDTKFIKLLFDIEYFSPPYLSGVPVEFSLENIHFGDPCYNKHDKFDCTSDPVDHSKLKIQCKQNFTGDDCSIPNKCWIQTTIKNKLQFGESYCGHNFGGTKQRHGLCVAEDENFKCICGFKDTEEENINWIRDKNICDKPQITLKGWIQDGNSYYPKNKANSLEISFLDIETDKYDVCVGFDYKTNINAILSVNYNENDMKYPIFLEKSNSKSYEICLHDFISTPDKNFTLSFVLTDNDQLLNDTNKFSLTEFHFHVHEKTPIKPDTKISLFEDPVKIDVTKGNNWKSNKDPTSKVNKYTLDASDVSPKHIDNRKFVFITEWIKYDSTVKSSKNQLKLSLDNFNEIDAHYGFIYMENGKPRIKTSLVTAKETILDFKPTGFYKLFIYFNVKKDEKNLDLAIETLSFNDPCSVDACHKTECITNPIYKCNFENLCQKKDDNPCSSCPALFGPGVPKFNCEFIDDKKYKCIVFDKYFNLKSTSCEQKFTYTTKQNQCDGTKCETLDLKTKFKFAGSDVPLVESVAPDSTIYFTSKTDSPLTFAINGFHGRSDECFELDYFIGKNSEIKLNLDDNKALSFKKFNFNKTLHEKNSQELCLSDLAKNFNQKSNVKIIPKLINNEVLSVSLKRLTKNTKNNSMSYVLRNILEYPITGINYDDQWALKSPKVAWYLDDTAIYFLGQPKGYPSLITTNWIQKYVTGMKIRFKLDSMIKSKSKLEIVQFDDKLTEKVFATLNITDDQDKYQSIGIPEIKTAFKIGLRVDSTADDKEDTAFYLTEYDIGDPCVDNKRQNPAKTCSSIGTCNRLAPVNQYKCDCGDDSGYTGVDCDIIDWCNSTQTFPNSIKEKGDVYCQDISKSVCVLGGIEGFHCDCSKVNNSYWDPITQSCKTKSKCSFLNCDLSIEKCDDTKTDPKCECDYEKGFISDPKDPNKCVKYNPCDDNQRKTYDKLKNITSEIPCKKNPNLICVFEDSNDINVAPYNCICDFGFKPAGGDKDSTICESQVCEIPYLNTCDQKCSPRNDNKFGVNCTCESDLYNLENNKCVLKKGIKCNCAGGGFCVTDGGECQCKDTPRYQYNNKDNKCELVSNDVSKSVCPSGKIELNNSTKSWECVCGTGFKWDEKNKICTLDDICGSKSKERQDCKDRNALCVIDLKNMIPKCKCPSGLISWPNPNNTTKCVDFCEMHSDKINCEAMKAECNSTVFLDDNLKEKKFEDLKPKDYCRCKPGYYWDDTVGCVVGQSVVKFTFEFENNFESLIPLISPKIYQYEPELQKSIYHQKIDEIINYANEENRQLNSELTKSLQKQMTDQAIIARVAKIIGSTDYKDYSPDSLGIIPADKDKSCTINGKIYKCNFAVNLGKKLSDYKKTLNELLTDPMLCIDTNPPSDFCFIPGLPKKNSYYAGTTGYDSILLTLNKKALKSSPIKYIEICSSSHNMCEDYSDCIQKSATDTSYSCICNTNFFNRTFQEKNTKFGQDVNEKCQVNKALCYKQCPKVNGYCYQTVNKYDNQKYSVTTSCGCNKSFKLSDDKTQCVESCAGVKCNKGQCKASGDNGFQCVCDEGFYGSNCEKEQTLSKGGWIAGIVVLAVLVVIVSGVAFMFARRSRNNSGGNNHPMDDYTGQTSYRTNQQSRGQSNPSFN